MISPYDSVFGTGSFLEDIREYNILVHNGGECFKSCEHLDWGHEQRKCQVMLWEPIGGCISVENIRNTSVQCLANDVFTQYVQHYLLCHFIEDWADSAFLVMVQ